MIKSVYDVAVVVSDGKKSAEWYKEKLGMEIRSNDDHWVTVSPTGSQTVLHLCESTPLEPGNSGIAFSVDDLEKTYQELSSKDVEFTVPPKTTEWGSFAKFKDPDGNEFWLFPD